MLKEWDFEREITVVFAIRLGRKFRVSYKNLKNQIIFKEPSYSVYDRSTIDISSIRIAYESLIIIFYSGNN